MERLGCAIRVVEPERAPAQKPTTMGGVVVAT